MKINIPGRRPKPYPNNMCRPTSEYPEVYNRDGDRMEFYYLYDQLMECYSLSKYFLWDRANYGLNTHFYMHNNMLTTKGSPIRKYGLLVESKAIVPDNYRIFDRHRGLEKEFTSIFTYDEDLLNRIENAVFFPGCAGAWYGKSGNSFVWDKDAYLKKTKNVSIVSSDKVACHLHNVRLQVARYCKRQGIADTYGTFDGGSYSLIDDSLMDYRYSFAIENDISDYFFTERIINCFAAQTIPIYLGARKIGNFFNADGIICVTEKDLEDVEKVLRICTKEYYEERKEAIMDNFRRAYRYQNVWDTLYLERLKED